MRLRMGKDCLSAGAVEGELSDHGAIGRDLLEELYVFGRGNEVNPGAEHANGSAFAAQRTLVGGRVNPARAAADNRDAQVSELVSQLAGDFDAVMGRHPRADHRHGVLVLGQQLPFHIQHNRRIIDLLQQLRVFRVGLRDDVAAEVSDALQFGAQVDGLLPVRNRLSRVVANPAHLHQLVFWTRSGLPAHPRNAPSIAVRGSGQRPPPGSKPPTPRENPCGGDSGLGRNPQVKAAG